MRQETPLALALHEGPSREAGPQVLSDPGEYIDAEVVFRQYCCPGCWTTIYSAIVPADHIDNVSTPQRLVQPA